MFKIGQRVVCINEDGWYDDTSRENCGGPDYLEEVTVEMIMADFVVLREYAAADSLGERECFLSECFRPLNEQFAESVLEKIMEEISQKELV